jgi:hypothetical protein
LKFSQLVMHSSTFAAQPSYAEVRPLKADMIWLTVLILSLMVFELYSINAVRELIIYA